MTRIVALHVDGGPGVGLGHTSRGIGLAAALDAQGGQAIFLVPEGSGLGEYLRRLNCPLMECPATATGLLDACTRTGAEALVIDSYRVRDPDLVRIADSGLPLVCFDDTAGRDFPAGLVVNGSPAALSLPYRARPGCRYLLGPSYQIVRPQFIPDVTRSHAGLPSTVLVTVGGDDHVGILDDLIAFFGSRWLALVPGSRVDVVIGPFARRLDRSGVPAGVRLHHSLSDLRALMIEADLAISAGGQTLFELARCGTPTVALSVADDQTPNLEVLARLGAIEYIGCANAPGWLDRLGSVLEKLRDDAPVRARLARTASHLIDGHGAARVAGTIAAMLVNRRLDIPSGRRPE